jgi:hypothetical protein
MLACVNLLVMAKEPIAGRVKTRLCPPCSPAEAAMVAEAALADTLDAALGSGADRVVLALDGSPGGWCPPGISIIPQVTGTLATRLTAAWTAVGGPGVQIGMDTPQVQPGHLDHAMDRLAAADIDAVLGPAIDGGWWLIGLRQPDDRVFADVPMSRADTGVRQRKRLVELGLRVAELPAMSDVDRFDDAVAVAESAPRTRFAAEVRQLVARIAAPTA